MASNSLYIASLLAGCFNSTTACHLNSTPVCHLNSTPACHPERSEGSLEIIFSRSFAALRMTSLVLFFLYFILNPQISKAEVTINGERLNYQNLNLIVKTFDGTEFDLQKNRGKVVVINFWAYWCTNCAREMTVLEALHQKYHTRGLEIIGVTVDRKSEQKRSLERIKNITYKNARLEDATLNNFSAVTALPTTYIFNKNGIIAAILTGSNQQDDNVLEREILPLLP